MKKLNTLEIEFYNLLNKLKEGNINLKESLIRFEKLITDFEYLSEKDVNEMEELKKEFKQLLLQIDRLNEIDFKIDELEKHIHSYNEKLKLFFS